MMTYNIRTEIQTFALNFANPHLYVIHLIKLIP